MTEGTTLAEWIQLDKQEAITIAPEQSHEIPFTILVPEEVAPGGHFAAILIGTKPPDDGKKLVVKTSQIVTSLFFVRIQGDVVESGHIRTFTVDDSVVSIPSAEFNLRFEN